MEVVHPRCCGLDVHKKTVVACVLSSGADGLPQRESRTFGTLTDELLRLGDWLAEREVSHVALESTGVYWKPVWNLLEDRFSLLLVNAQHVKAVPGRKTDVKDCQWLAELLRHGLLRPSVVPDRAQREVREVSRYRTALVRERSAEVNRLHKTLEGANIKLAAVATDLLGRSGRQMLEALVAGETDPATLAALARGRLRDKLPQLERALAGRVGPHQRFLLARQLAHLDYLESCLAEVSAELARRLHPFAALLTRLGTIPGIGPRTAEVLLAEIGPEVSRFPSAGHLASWAALCPGNHQSAGKRLSGATRQGNPWLRTALIEAAQAAGRSKNTALAARYHRLAARHGRKRAVVAVAHALLRIVYHLLRGTAPYQDECAQARDQRAAQRREQRQVRELRDRGYTVIPPHQEVA